MKPFKVIIVDNDPDSRANLKLILNAHPEIDVIDEASFGCDAIIKILQNKPAIIFLDLSVTHPDSMEVLREVWQHYRPAILFTKGIDTRPIRTRGIRCLLKPYHPDDVSASVREVINLPAGGSQPGIEDMIGSLLGQPAEDLWLDGIRNLVVSEPDALRLLRVDDVAHFVSNGNDTSLQTKSRRYTINDNIASLEYRLDRSFMIRTSPSDIININFMEGLECGEGGDYSVRLSTGARVKWEAGYRDNIKKSLARLV